MLSTRKWYAMNPVPNDIQAIAVMAFLLLVLAVCSPHLRSAVDAAHAAPENRIAAAMHGWGQPDRDFEAHLDRVQKRYPQYNVRACLAAGY